MGLKIEMLENEINHMLLSLSGRVEGVVEIHFDEGRFNGKILFNAHGNTIIEDKWRSIRSGDGEIYNILKNYAIEKHKN